MIRPRNAPRPDSCCGSADVLTGPERACQLPKLPDVPKHRQGIEWHCGLRWGDVESIACVLRALRSSHD